MPGKRERHSGAVPSALRQPTVSASARPMVSAEACAHTDEGPAKGLGDSAFARNPGEAICADLRTSGIREREIGWRWPARPP